MANFLNNQSMAGLNTTTIGVPTTDRYTIQGTVQTTQSTPTPTAGPGGGAGTGTNASPTQDIPSQVVVTIKKNSTTIYTSIAGDRGFLTTASFTAGDIISVITTSSLAQDQDKNATQTTIQVYESAT